MKPIDSTHPDLKNYWNWEVYHFTQQVNILLVLLSIRKGSKQQIRMQKWRVRKRNMLRMRTVPWNGVLTKMVKQKTQKHWKISALLEAILKFTDLSDLKKLWNQGNLFSSGLMIMQKHRSNVDIDHLACISSVVTVKKEWIYRKPISYAKDGKRIL